MNVYLGHKDFQLHLSLPCLRYGVSDIFISPDESLLLFTNYKCYKMFYIKGDEVPLTHIYDLKTKQQLHTVDSTLVVELGTSIFTKDNKPVTSKAGKLNESTVVIYDMVKGETSKEIQLNQKPDLMTLHKSHKYVLIGYQSTVVINGKNDKFAALRNLETREISGECPVNGPYNNMEMFGQEELYYVVCPWNELKGYILYAG